MDLPAFDTKADERDIDSVATRARTFVFLIGGFLLILRWTISYTQANVALSDEHINFHVSYFVRAANLCLLSLQFCSVAAFGAFSLKQWFLSSSSTTRHTRLGKWRTLIFRFPYNPQGARFILYALTDILMISILLFMGAAASFLLPINRPLSYLASILGGSTSGIYIALVIRRIKISSSCATSLGRFCSHLLTSIGRVASNIVLAPHRLWPPARVAKKRSAEPGKNLPARTKEQEVETKYIKVEEAVNADVHFTLSVSTLTHFVYWGCHTTIWAWDEVIASSSDDTSRNGAEHTTSPPPDASLAVLYHARARSLYRTALLLNGLVALIALLAKMWLFHPSSAVDEDTRRIRVLRFRYKNIWGLNLTFTMKELQIVACLLCCATIYFRLYLLDPFFAYLGLAMLIAVIGSYMSMIFADIADGSPFSTPCTILLYYLVEISTNSTAAIRRFAHTAIFQR